MMETKISDFHTCFYIPDIQQLAFHLPHVRILGTNNCGEMRRTAFKRRELFQDILCRRDYYDRAVASIDHQIQSEYYGGNRSVSIYGIALENLLHYQRHTLIQLHNHVKVMQCFIIFYLAIANRMLPLLLYT